MIGDSPRLLRSLAVMAAVIGAWWALPGVVRRISRESFYEFQAPLFIAESRLKDLRRYWELSSRSNDTLIANGRDLARSNADLAVRLAETQSLREENKRLEDALGLPSKPMLRQVVARVAQRDISRWWSHVILAKGRNHGVRQGCAVVNGGGVVGRVTLAHAMTCEVELATDPAFRISANLDGDNRPVVYHGATAVPFAPPRGTVTNIPADFKNETGGPLRLVTTGVGGVFPGGLYIGTLEAEPSATTDGLFKEAAVLVRPDLADLQEATILVPVEPDNAGVSP